MIKASNKITPTNVPILQFSGNWIIDLGILGFVNLLEEIYNWDLQETLKRIEENKEIVYYGLFPFAYICSEIKRKNSAIPRDLIKSFIDEIYRRQFESGKEIFDFTWENYITRAAADLWKEKIMENAIDSSKFKKGAPGALKENLKKIEDFGKRFIKENRDEIKKFLDKKGRFQKFKYEDIKRFQKTSIKKFEKYTDKFLKDAKKFKKMISEIDKYINELWNNEVIGNRDMPKERDAFYRIPIDNIYYKNFLFFNYSTGYKGQKESFYFAIAARLDQKETLTRMDKTINKFLASYGEAPNIYYTPLKTKHLINTIPYLFVYLLCFDRAFEYYRNIGYLVFYSNDISVTYEINKRLKVRKSKLEAEEDSNSIFRGTWQMVIDSIIEQESWWVLENLYLIKHRGVDTNSQRLIDVEYMGISRLQASVLVDDVIRENLNQRLQVENTEYKWLFEEFIKNKHLMPLIMDHLHLRLNQKTKQRKIKPIIYALAIEAELFPRSNFTHLFEDPISLKVRFDDLILRIRETYQKMNLARKNIKLLFRDIEGDNAPLLFSIIRRQNKYSFVNSILKLIISSQEDNKGLIRYLNNYVFDHIVQNDERWIYYALGLLIGFMGG